MLLCGVSVWYGVLLCGVSVWCGVWWLEYDVLFCSGVSVLRASSILWWYLIRLYII